MFHAIVGALLIGLTLGLFGSGGSIVTVPVLTYLLGHEAKVAVAESLGIVGAVALVAMLPFAVAGRINWRSVLYFGLPGMAGTYGGAWLALYVPGAVQLTLFGGVMILAAYMMTRESSGQDNQPSGRHATWKIVAEGLAVGVLTGLVGVGGGFLIVPALVVLGGLPMRTAVGTSLVIIALKSASGFVKYQDVLKELDLSVDWTTIGVFVALGVAGSFAGSYLGSRLNQAVAKKAFAVFLVVMGVFVILKEAPALLPTGT